MNGGGETTITYSFSLRTVFKSITFQSLITHHLLCSRVTESNRIGFIFESSYRAYWSKNFFLHDLHVFGYIAEDGRFNKIAFFAYTLAPGLNLRAFLFAMFNVARNARLASLQAQWRLLSHLIIRSNCTFDTCGPWNVFKSKGSPTTFSSARALNRSTNLS